MQQGEPARSLGDMQAGHLVHGQQLYNGVRVLLYLAAQVAQAMKAVLPAHNVQLGPARVICDRDYAYAIQ